MPLVRMIPLYQMVKMIIDSVAPVDMIQMVRMIIYTLLIFFTLQV